jgi:hypothetical protein
MALKKKLDFSNVSEGFDVLPAGTYTCHVFDLQDKVSSKGNDMLKVTLKVSKGEHKGRQIFTNLVFTESALFKIREFLLACGAQIPKKAVDIDFSKCVGKEVKVIIYHRKNTDTNETYSDVKKFLALNADAGNDGGQASGSVELNINDDDEVPFK